MLYFHQVFIIFSIEIVFVLCFTCKTGKKIVNFYMNFKFCCIFLGHFGDPFASPHGQCEQCSCYRRGTEQTDDGVDICDQLSGNFIK